MRFGGTIIIESHEITGDTRHKLEHRLLRRSLSTAGDGRRIVVNCGTYKHRERFKQWLDYQNVKFTFVSCDEPA